MMFLSLGVLETLKMAAKPLIVILLMIGVVIGAMLISNKYAPLADQSDTLLQEHKANVEAQLQKWQDRTVLLEEELKTLRSDFEYLQEEVRQSIEAREEEHDAVDSTTSIDAIDAVLKRGVPGVSGRVDN